MFVNNHDSHSLEPCLCVSPRRRARSRVRRVFQSHTRTDLCIRVTADGIAGSHSLARQHVHRSSHANRHHGAHRRAPSRSFVSARHTDGARATRASRDAATIIGDSVSGSRTIETDAAGRARERRVARRSGANECIAARSRGERTRRLTHDRARDRRPRRRRRSPRSASKRRRRSAWPPSSRFRFKSPRLAPISPPICSRRRKRTRS